MAWLERALHTAQQDQAWQEQLWGALLGTCFAAVALTAGGAVAHAEAASPATLPEDQSDAFGAASRALQAAWSDLDMDLHRLEPPQIQSQGGRLSIRLPLRTGADVSAVLAEVAARLGAAVTGHEQQGTDAQSSEGGQATVLRFGGQAAGSLSARVRLAPEGSQRLGAQPEVEFCKQGALSEQELKDVAAVMRATNSIVRRQGNTSTIKVQSHSSGAQLDGLLGQVDGALRGFGHAAGLLSGFPEEVQELFRQVQGEVDQMFRRDQPAGEEHGLDDPAFDEFPQSAEPRHRHPGFGAEDWPPQQQHHLRRPPAATAARTEPQQQWQFGSREADAAVKKLQGMGATVHAPTKDGAVDWGVLAGYEDQKRQIEDTLLLALQHPEVYEALARRTRRSFASNRPRAVLFEGPPGTGKTTSARVIANQAAVPLIYVPLEAVASKWYGESERLLSQVFKTAEQLPGAIIFLDEIDSLATTRSSDMHEATRKLLGVLLRHLDGFEGQKRSVVIAETNRMQDLDPALLSRFDTAIDFGLPSETTRREILRQYAQHLSDEQLAQVAAATSNLSGRDLRDLSEQTERRWASKIIKKQVSADELPSIAAYLEAAEQRVKERTSAERRAKMPYHWLANST